MEGVPFNESGLYLQDEYDVGYSGMYLMDCQALMALARLINRTAVVPVLQSRFDQVNKPLATTWNESAGYYQNKLSSTLAPIERMAPTHFYPLLVGPAAGPSNRQVTETVTRHLTNPARFAVWPSGSGPAVHPVPPETARPLAQWVSAAGQHTLCCQLACDFEQRSLGRKKRYEGMGLAAIPQGRASAGLLPLFNYTCGPKDTALGPAGWNSTHASCMQSGQAPVLYVYRSGAAASNLVQLELWYGSGDHYAVSSEEGKLDATALGYKRGGGLGWVFPPPGTENATSRYGLPSISRDDLDYIDQNYWHGRIWSPMIQLVYWGLAQYAPSNSAARGALDGLVAQSKALLLKEWRGYGDARGYATGRYVYENFGADTGEGYGYSSEAQPLYSWGALAGFIGLQANGFYPTAAW